MRINEEKSRGELTVIEFSNHSIKLAQSESGKQGQINKLVVRDGIADSEIEFAKALENIISQSQIKIEDLVVSLDRSLVTIRPIKLPYTNEEEVKEMAEWQASKLLPYKVEEMAVSHQTVTIDEEGFAHIILVIVPRQTINKFIHVCEAVKLKPKTVTISSEGLLRWYTDVQCRHSHETLLLVDVQKDRLELVIIDQDKFMFSRSFDVVMGSAQADSKIIEESRLSMEYFRKQENSRQVKNIILTGDSELAANLELVFRDAFDLPVDTIDHLQDLDFPGEKPALEIRKDYSFASVCGLALSKNQLRIDLCPRDVRESIMYQEKRGELLKTSVLILAAILVLAGVVAFSFQYKQKIINMLTTQIAKIDPAAREIQKMKDKLSLINRQLSHKGSCIEVLREAHRIIPKDIYLNAFIYTESDKLLLKGTSPDMSSVFKLVSVLNESPLFENVQVSYATQRKIAMGELTDFEIVCKLSDRINRYELI